MILPALVSGLDREVECPSERQLPCRFPFPRSASLFSAVTLQGWWVRGVVREREASSSTKPTAPPTTRAAFRHPLPSAFVHLSHPRVGRRPGETDTTATTDKTTTDKDQTIRQQDRRRDTTTKDNETRQRQAAAEKNKTPAQRTPEARSQRRRSRAGRDRHPLGVSYTRRKERYRPQPEQYADCIFTRFT